MPDGGRGIDPPYPLGKMRIAGLRVRTGLPKPWRLHYDGCMKRLLIVAFAALLTLSPWVRAEGPDDKYIEIYQIIQEGDQLAARGQADLARQRYSEAQTELKKLQASYPNWNEKLVEFRLR